MVKINIPGSLKIAFLLPDHFEKRGSWGETAESMRRSLQDLFPGLYPVYLKRPSFKMMRTLNRLTGKLFGRSYNLAHSSSYAHFLARQAEAEFRLNPPDVVIAPAFSTAIACLETKIPVIYISDTTFHLLYDYYDWFTGFWPWSVKEGNKLEGLAIRNSAFCIFASNWAAASAINNYKADQGKVKVIPFGANLITPPSPESLSFKEKGDKCRLIFIGMEWERKGGPLVMETFYKLKKSGTPAQLDIVGCNPPIDVFQPGIRVFPYIDKSTPSGLKLFSDLMAEQHFLFVPSQAECFGLVFAEASAYGIPSITKDTGGIPDVVINGENGFRLPPDAGPEEYARVISDIYQHFNERYKPLALTSSGLYQSRLNWGRWAHEMSSLILITVAHPLQNPR